MSWNLDKITDAISPLGGKTFKDDEKRIYAGLTVALAQADSLYTDRYKIDQAGLSPHREAEGVILPHRSD